MKYLLLFLGALFIVQCTKVVEEPTYEDVGNIENVLLSNFTGHLIRRGGVLCGDGVHVRFDIITKRSTDSYFYAPDTYFEIPLKLERGENVTIRAFESTGEGDGFLLASKTAKFDPPTESYIQSRPEIVLCPKNVINIYDFE